MNKKPSSNSNISNFREQEKSIDTSFNSKLEPNSNKEYILDVKNFRVIGNSDNGSILKKRKLKNASFEPKDLDKEYLFKKIIYNKKKEKELEDKRKGFEFKINEVKRNFESQIFKIKQEIDNEQTRKNLEKKNSKLLIKEKIENFYSDQWREKIDDMKSDNLKKKKELELSFKSKLNYSKSETLKQKINELESNIKETKRKIQKILDSFSENEKASLNSKFEEKINEYIKFLENSKSKRLENLKKNFEIKETLKKNETLITFLDEKKEQIKLIYQKRSELEKIKMNESLQEKVNFYERQEKLLLEERLQEFRKNYEAVNLQEEELNMLNEEEALRRMNQAKLESFKKSVEQDVYLKKLVRNKIN